MEVFGLGASLGKPDQEIEVLIVNVAHGAPMEDMVRLDARICKL